MKIFKIFLEKICYGFGFGSGMGISFKLLNTQNNTFKNNTKKEK